MPLKPFTYPLPETRFLHAGRLVYKFKIRYGNFNSADDLDNTESTVKELEEAIRVILGNLDDLHPFSTERFTIFPYLSKWQRVSKMRFKHGDVHLVPYPYICTMYLELNSFQQNVSFGKEVHKGSYKIVKERSEMSKSTEIEGTVKRRRVEEEAEIPYPESDMDRTAAGCVHSMSKAKCGFEMNYSKEIQCEYSPASLIMACNRRNLWGPVECNSEKNTETSQAEGEIQLPQQMGQIRNKGNTELKGRGLSEFWRSIFFSPLQHLFGGNN